MNLKHLENKWKFNTAFKVEKHKQKNVYFQSLNFNMQYVGILRLLN